MQNTRRNSHLRVIHAARGIGLGLFCEPEILSLERVRQAEPHATPLIEGRRDGASPRDADATASIRPSVSGGRPLEVMSARHGRLHVRDSSSRTDPVRGSSVAPFAFGSRTSTSVRTEVSTVDARNADLQFTITR